LQVAWPNVPFPAPPATDKPDTYLQASVLRAQTQGIGIAAWDEHAGILQVDVLYKPSGRRDQAAQCGRRRCSVVRARDAHAERQRSG
jgi:hypothetical protein